MERSRESWHRTSGKDGKLATTSSCSFVVLNRFVIDAKVSLKASRGRFPVAGLHLIGRRATPATRQPLLQRRSRHQRINTYCKIDPTANNTDRHTTAQLNSALIRPTTSTDAVIVTSENTTSNFKGSYRGRSRGCSDKEAFKLKASLSFELLGKIDGVDVLATEARYHESCRRNYVRRDSRQHHQTGCSDISVGVMTERKAVQRRLRYCMTVQTRKNWYSLVLLYACICITTCISSVWRSCIRLSKIQTTTFRRRWRSYLNHFGDQLQFWHPHWIPFSPCLLW